MPHHSDVLRGQSFLGQRILEWEGLGRPNHPGLSGPELPAQLLSGPGISLGAFL